MVTKKQKRPVQPPKVPKRRRPFYLKEWRKFMGAKVIDLAEAVDVERESYYRQEREPWRLSLQDIDNLADVLGIRPSQLWFAPPSTGAKKNVSLDDLLEDAPDGVQEMAINAVRGMLGK